MKVLVTGATGFLGGKLALRLVSLGYDVTGIGRNNQIGHALAGQGVRFVACDLAHTEKIAQLCGHQDYVFHCGALSSPWGTYQNFYTANVTGTKNVIAGCRAARVKRLIHVSTPSLYFHYNERLDVEEGDELPRTFVNHYAKTKQLAEQEIDRAFHEGLPVVTIRPRAIFGPGDNAILPRLLYVCEKGTFPKIGSGHVMTDLTYVENVVDALLLCMHSGDHTLGQKYNITNGVQVNLYDIIGRVTAMLGMPVTYKEVSYQAAFFAAVVLEGVYILFLRGKEPPLTRYTVSVLSKSQTLNIDKAKKELGYSPRITVEEGIHAFVDWWQTNGD